MLTVEIDNISFDRDRNKWITYYKVLDNSTIEACTGTCLYSSDAVILEDNITKSCRVKVLRYIEKRDRTNAAILAVSTFDIEAAVQSTALGRS